MENTLVNRSLWVTLAAKGMPFKTELELSNIILHEVNVNLNEMDKIKSTEILSVQKISTRDPLWIIYCESTECKAKLLATNTITVDGKQYDLYDLNQCYITGVGKNPGIRISIHGLPFSIRDEEVEQWIDTWATRCSKVMKAKVKTPRNASETNFNHLLNGHRFCYAREITDPQRRYSLYSIPNPQNPLELIDVQITVYHNDQVVNCRKCLSDDHETKDCAPQKKQQNPNLVIFRGHKHPLSNFFPVALDYDGQTFPSSEHMYQYIKCMFHGETDLANQILTADTAFKAKQIAESSNCDTTEWREECIVAMKLVTEVKFDQCP